MYFRLVSKHHLQVFAAANKNDNTVVIVI